MRSEIIADINKVKHLAIYHTVVHRYRIASMALVTSFLVMFLSGIVAMIMYRKPEIEHKLNWFAAYFGFFFIGVIILCSIDRAIQFIQINRIKKKYNINTRIVLAQYFKDSNFPWMVV